MNDRDAFARDAAKFVWETLMNDREAFARDAANYVCSLERCWPYDPEGTTAGGGGPWGTFDVVNIDPHFSRILAMTEDQLRAGIMTEIASAMWYVTVAHPSWSRPQALEAFKMFRLVHQGIHYRQPFEEIPRPLEATARADYLLHYADSESRLGEHYWVNHLVSVQWPESGRYMQPHAPISEKPLAELRAIYLVVCDQFENMC